MGFVRFSSRLRRLGPYNVYMVYAQRPGAQAVATKSDWAAVGQIVRDDAIPILILRPRGPIEQVFELADTLPPQQRDPRVDPLAATGDFNPARLDALIERLGKLKSRELKIAVVDEDFGGNLAGRIVRQPLGQNEKLAGSEGMSAIARGEQDHEWRIKLNRRMTDQERFATLTHELGHLFCGHVGACVVDNPKADEYGWPDRSGLPNSIMEIEAELVAWCVCDREGLVTGSPLYLRAHMEAAGNDLGRVDLDRVIRAIARVHQYLPRTMTKVPNKI